MEKRKAGVLTTAAPSMSHRNENSGPTPLDPVAPLSLICNVKPSMSLQEAHLTLQPKRHGQMQPGSSGAQCSGGSEDHSTL